jgi:uncharacterized protein (TIGR02145 family)
VTGTATGSGTDYTLANGTATIAAGSTSTNIVLAIVEDALDETDETVILTLSNATNATASGDTVHTHTITDDDGAVFATVVIGTQTWSASNVSLVPTTNNDLNTDYWNAYVGTNGSGDATDEDGFYYTAAAAMNVCPSGWSLPSDSDFATLEEAALAGDSGVAWATTTGYRGTTEGTQLMVGGDSRFEAKLAGYRHPDGDFTRRGGLTYFWARSDSNPTYLFIHTLDSSLATVGRWAIQQDEFGFSVRCLKD